MNSHFNSFQFAAARYALGVGERCGEMACQSMAYHSAASLETAPTVFAVVICLPHVPICLVLSREAPQGSGPAFASGDMVDATDATGICSITE
jgi:hypothetical protein